MVIKVDPENLVQRILTAQDISHVPAVHWELLMRPQKGKNMLGKCQVMNPLQLQDWLLTLCIHIWVQVQMVLFTATAVGKG